MRYVIQKTLKKVEENEDVTNQHYVDLISLEDAKKNHDFFDLKHLKTVRRCKANVYEKGIFITLDIPDLKNIKRKRWSSAIYLDKQKLLVVGNVSKLNTELEKIVSTSITDLYTPAQVLFTILEYMISDDDVIDSYVESFNRMEEALAKKETNSKFEEKIIHYQKHISVLCRYYQQLLDLVSSLIGCPFSIISQDEKQLFQFLYNQVDLYNDEVQKLKEQLVSLSDHYQIVHNERQESAVRYLTIVTSIFMPLTLLTGWYGMNFSKMPELDWEHGYEIVIVIAILILVIQLYIFKKKKWI